MTLLKKYKFSDFVEINPSVKLKVNEEHPFIEMADLNDGWRNAYPSTNRKLTGGARFEEGDTLFARITPCLENGKICQAKGLTGGKGFGSTEFLVFRGKENISDSNFVYYLSRWDDVRRFAELHLVGTSGRQRVPKDVFENLELELPKDLSTQTRIAFILSSLDDKIELNRRTNHTLEQIAQTLFKKYFVDDIDPENLPEGWEVKEINKIISVKDGTHDSPKQKESGYHLITSKHIKDSQIDFEQAYFISEADFEAINKRSKVDTFDILLTMIGTVGVLHLVLEEEIKFAIKNIGLFKSSERKDLFEFLYLFLKSNFITEYLEARKSGSTQQYLTLDTLRNIPVTLPPSNILADFKERVNPLIMKIRNNDSEILSLIKSRDLLLPKLMSGQIELNIIERELAEV